MRLQLKSSICKPGLSDKANEDCIGCNDFIAFVIDGATGLGDRQYMSDHASDAAWLSEFTARYLLTHLTEMDHVQNLFADLMQEAADEFYRSAGMNDVPRYSWPAASILLVCANQEHIDIYGLGDCVAYMRHSDGTVQKLSALLGYAEAESRFALGHVKRSNGMDREHLLDDSEIKEQLRVIRAAQNTPDGHIWTLGLVPDASDHLHHVRVQPEDAASILLCSDGFSALEETYKAYTPVSLMNAADNAGLDKLYLELRHIENHVDPTAIRYPRFKRSDDASAVLINVVH